ncbi:MAG TPA: 2-vinyl bacteriochlorophyllide hydratase [Roseiflexaceae bacterium]|nr:2-vinyl bacteriochlorophyllide hydratase [Roseiflexaceae bacterium]HMP39159.1 2-vinyl bacteriochlorophyllide hydratase [Roseiflexaceae bacterium]
MYTAEQLQRRDASPWTKVQAILAPIQFLVFLISFALVVRYLVYGDGFLIATISVWIKIALLWAITITGMIWEKEIFGHYFMAREFFWEDLGNLVAIISHNLYFVAQALHWSDRSLMLLMLVAYCTYLINCGQFIWRGIQAGKQRRAQRQQAVLS